MTVYSAQAVAVASGDGSNRDGSSGCENQGSLAAGSGCGHRTLVRTGSTATVATATSGYWQRRGRCSEAQGGGS